MHDGAFSHLALEAAGLDLAQWLGVKIRGDEMLPHDLRTGQHLLQRANLGFGSS